MRIPYTPDPPPTNTPNEAEILARVQARRAPRGLLPLDRALLHSFPVADGWNAFLGAIRQRTSLAPIVRELIISRVAILNGALFEWESHAPLLMEAGLSDVALQVVGDPQADIDGKMAEGVLSATEGAVLRYSDAMTKTVTVPDGVFQAVRDRFNEREVVEITSTAAAYNCVSRFLVALDVGEKNQ